jgi:hypothetical protein
MGYEITAVVSFIAGVIVTLIYRIQVEKKLASELDSLKASAQGAIGKL